MQYSLVFAVAMNFNVKIIAAMHFNGNKVFASAWPTACDASVWSAVDNPRQACGYGTGVAPHVRGGSPRRVG